jgi:hypothetical protein
MALSPNWLTKQIEVSSPQVVITAQDLINDIRDFEYSWDGMAYERIADASGKEDLGNGVSVGITVSLLSPWQILWYVGNYIATISGGNLVGGLGGDPVAYTAGVQVVIIQSAASTVVATGSGVLPSDVEDIKDAVWDAQTSDHQIVGSTGKALSDVSGGSSPETIAAAVWSHATRTLTSFGSLVANIWANVTRTLTAGTKDTEIDELHKLQGLKEGSPMTVTPTSRTVDDIDLEITGDGENTTTVTRQP